MERITSDCINSHYVEILKKCVEEGTSCFNSSWFYAKFRGAPISILKAMKKSNLINNKYGTHIWYLKQMYSQIRYIGLCIASKLGDVNKQEMDSFIPLAICAQKTLLEPDIISFLCKTTHLTTQQRANILEMSPKEVELLEDYFYMRLGTNAIKADLKFNFGQQDSLSIFMNTSE